MSPCDQHSGMCVSMSTVKESLKDLELKLEHQRGVFEGQMTKANSDIQDLGNKLRKEISDAIADIKKLIESKDAKAASKTWNIINGLISPTIVGIVLFLLTKLWK